MMYRSAEAIEPDYAYCRPRAYSRWARLEKQQAPKADLPGRPPNNTGYLRSTTYRQIRDRFTHPKDGAALECIAIRSIPLVASQR